MIVAGVEVTDLPEGAMPVEVVVIVKCMMDDGQMALIHRWSPALSGWEALGMTTVCSDTLRDALREMTS